MIKQRRAELKAQPKDNARTVVRAIVVEMEKNTSVPHTVRFEYDPSKLAMLAMAVCNESGAVLHEVFVRDYQ